MLGSGILRVHSRKRNVMRDGTRRTNQTPKVFESLDTTITSVARAVNDVRRWMGVVSHSKRVAPAARIDPRVGGGFQFDVVTRVERHRLW